MIKRIHEASLQDRSEAMLLAEHETKIDLLNKETLSKTMIALLR